MEQGTPVGLELVVHKPALAGPLPTLVFNHGSTGWGTNPAVFRRTVKCAPVAQFFAERGWMVVFPQRRGRGKSGGLYDEGFKPDRSGYSWEPEVSLAGLDRAVQDLDEVMYHLAQRPDVRSEQLLIGGVSRGGVLAIAYAGARPGMFRGALNFNGGWLGCSGASYAEVNRRAFVRGATFQHQTLWLHGSKDPYYRIAHCRKNFDTFQAAGGKGVFHEIRGGHGLAYRPALWTDAMDSYLASIG
ncbi:MAG: prolyl oligopeptidase family serine peptidase [Proteobacteria bacterium]|nr:prolyl oligopeptidase family serine peptidase [Pseudomonadota bacterium]